MTDKKTEIDRRSFVTGAIGAAAGLSVLTSAQAQPPEGREIGTTAGAMLPDSTGGLVKDERGAVVLSYRRARAAGRQVKVALQRPLMFNNASGQDWTSLTLTETGVPAEQVTCVQTVFLSCTVTGREDGSIGA